MQKKIAKKALMAVSTIALTIAIMAVMPALVNFMSRKLYQARTNASDINFEDLGPEIVAKNAEEGETEQDRGASWQ